jgi:hypothetical protein
MSRNRENSPNPGLNTAHYPMHMTLPSQFRLDFNSLSHFAVAYSAIP